MVDAMLVSLLLLCLIFSHTAGRRAEQRGYRYQRYLLLSLLSIPLVIHLMIANLPDLTEQGTDTEK